MERVPKQDSMSSWYPTSQNRDVGHPDSVCDLHGWSRFVVSHPFHDPIQEADPSTPVAAATFAQEDGAPIFVLIETETDEFEGDDLLFGGAGGEGLLQVLAGFVYCALSVVVGLHGQAVLVDGAVSLAGAVEDFA